MFTRSGDNAKLYISGRGAPSLELNLKRENTKWILLDGAPEIKQDLFSFAIHDFMCEKISVNGTASEICSMLKEKYPDQEFNCNWLYRDLLQHNDEICSFGIDYGKTKSNGVRSIYITYHADRDSSGGKILYTENAVPVVPDNSANADETLIDIECSELTSKENAVPVKVTDGNSLITMAAEMMRRNLTRQGIFVPAFNSEL